MKWAQENIKKALSGALIIGGAVVAFINAITPFLKSLLAMID